MRHEARAKKQGHGHNSMVKSGITCRCSCRCHCFSLYLLLNASTGCSLEAIHAGRNPNNNPIPTEMHSPTTILKNPITIVKFVPLLLINSCKKIVITQSNVIPIMPGNRAAGSRGTRIRGRPFETTSACGRSTARGKSATNLAGAMPDNDARVGRGARQAGRTLCGVELQAAC